MVFVCQVAACQCAWWFAVNAHEWLADSMLMLHAPHTCSLVLSVIFVQIWDTFMDYIEPYSSQAPYMIAIGAFA